MKFYFMLLHKKKAQFSWVFGQLKSSTYLKKFMCDIRFQNVAEYPIHLCLLFTSHVRKMSLLNNIIKGVFPKNIKFINPINL